MKSVQYGPTATRDEHNNFVFSTQVLAVYKNNLPGVRGSKRFHDLTGDEEPVGSLEGIEFKFTNGPYGGGRKFTVLMVTEDGLVAREQ